MNKIILKTICVVLLQNSQTRQDQTKLRAEFKDIKDFDPVRSIELDLVSRVIISHITRDSIWDQETLDEVYKLDEFIQTIVVGGKDYGNLCLKSSNLCAGNGLSVLNTTHNLTFPVHEIDIHPGLDPVPVFLGHLLGGVTTSGDDSIVDVAAIHLTYYVEDTELGREWASKFIKELDKRMFTHIQVEHWQVRS